MRVVLDAVGHAFDGRPTLFTALSATLAPAHVYALVGPSGSGKSTLLSLLAGWLEPTDGEVRRDGVERIGWVFQNPHGVARRTAVDHVALPLLARGAHRARAHADARRLLERFGLGDAADRPFAQLSGGEAQRLMLARGLASAPDLFLVDEPTAQLDRAAAHDVTQSLAALAGSGAIVVVATHDTAVRDACTDVIDLAEHR